MKAPKTICSNCKHAYSVSTSRLFSQSVWYEQFCRAFRTQKAVSPVTGKEIWVDNGYPTPYEHAFCRDRNNGNCERYVPVPNWIGASDA